MSEPHPIDILLHEHNVIARVLDALAVLSSELEEGRAVSVDALHGGILFMLEFADRCHHAKEEDILFPLLARKGIPDAGGPLEVIRREHREGRAAVASLAEAVEAYAQNKFGACRRLNGGVKELVQYYRNHILKENMVLFSMAERILMGEEVSTLHKEFEQAGANLDRHMSVWKDWRGISRLSSRHVTQRSRKKLL